TLVPLKDPVYQLIPLGEAKVADRDALGIRISKESQPDVKLYFDKQTAHVLKSELVEVDEATGKNELVEMYYSDHRRMNGVLIPGKTITVRNGRVIREIQLLDFQPNAKMDPRLFQKP